MTRQRLHPSPFAVSIDGSILVNVTLADDAEDRASAIREALEPGGRFFVGVEPRCRSDRASAVFATLDTSA